MPDIDTSKLEAVNEMLSLIGEAPVNSLTVNPTADVAMAEATLDRASKDLQMQSWHWNTDRDMELTPDSDGKFAWQSNWVQFDTDRGRYTNVDLVRRGEFLYDLKTRTAVIPLDTIQGNAVIYLEWEELPEAARSYIMVRAARIFLMKSVGDEERAGYAIEDERRAWHVLMDYESDQGDYNLFDVGVATLLRRPGGSGLLPGVDLKT